MESSLPIVAIIGRPNVGKSALFNRLIGRRISIVHEESGVTRDHIALPATHRGRHFLLVDTGGLGVLVREKHVGTVDGLIRDSVTAVVSEAAVVLWVVDAIDGLTPQDKEVGSLLRESGCSLVLVANKVDNADRADAACAEFSGLGVNPLVPTSCTQNTGINDLLEAIVTRIPYVSDPVQTGTGMNVAVVGRPNVGKSSLVNAILGADRVMVSEVAGTTRDAVDVPLNVAFGDETVALTLIDTAGLRRERRVDSAVEFYSMARTRTAIRRSDAVILMLDATDPGTAQDRRIARQIMDAGKPCLMVANKWDLVSGRIPQAELLSLFRAALPFIGHAPLVAVSATRGYQLDRVFDRLRHMRAQMQVSIPTAVLNQFIQDTLVRTPPAQTGRRRFKIFYATMVGTPPPHIILFCNSRRDCPANYLQFLENRIRDAFYPEAGLPIRLELRERRRGEQPGGARSAIAGVMRRKQEARQARQRHNARRKGWRKRR